MGLMWRMFKAPVATERAVRRARGWTILILAVLLLVDFATLPAHWEREPGGVYRAILDPPGMEISGLRLSVCVIEDDDGTILIHSVAEDPTSTPASDAFISCSHRHRQIGLWSPVMTYREVRVSRDLFSVPSRVVAPEGTPFPERYNEALVAYLDETDPERWLFGLKEERARLNSPAAGGAPAGASYSAGARGYAYTGLDADGVRDAIANGGWTDHRVHVLGVAHNLWAIVAFVSIVWLGALEIVSTHVEVKRSQRRSRGLCAFCAYDLRGAGAAEGGVCPECGRAVEGQA